LSLGAGIDVSVSVLDSLFIAPADNARRFADRVYSDAIWPPAQPKIASNSATVAPWLAAFVAAALPQAVRGFPNPGRLAGFCEQVAEASGPRLSLDEYHGTLHRKPH
jgi:hypothetical protein